MTDLDIARRTRGDLFRHRDDVMLAVRGEGFHAVFGAIDALFNEGRPGMLVPRVGERGLDLVNARDAKNAGAAGAFCRLDAMKGRGLPLLVMFPADAGVFTFPRIMGGPYERV